VTPYERLRASRVLRNAWTKVRASGLESESSQTKQDTRRFEKDWPNALAKLQGRLRRGEFAFDGEKGVPLSKGRGKAGIRPIVLAPIENRIVRRAILEVLQGYGTADDPPRRRWAGVPEVRAVMATPTSIGGIPERGVPHGLSLIDQSVRAGLNWFVRSDIRNFFTKIPKPEVNRFIRDAVQDDQFATFFDSALATNLENQEELEERNQFKHFPNPKIGVAQGSALSALAGNIVLREFDTAMNGRGIVCVRYIDDFIMLGRSNTAVLAAYHSAKKMLSRIEMEVYELTDEAAVASGKVHSGNIYRGTDILGYRISGNSLQPSDASCRKLLIKLDKVVANAKEAMRTATTSIPASHALRYHQAAVTLHEIIWGWAQSFKYTTARQSFVSLDTEIDKRIVALGGAVQQLVGENGRETKRRVIGIHLLADTPPASLMELLGKEEAEACDDQSAARSLQRPAEISPHV
jgi:RNA-directed DNA polymerase